MVKNIDCLNKNQQQINDKTKHIKNMPICLYPSKIISVKKNLTISILVYMHTISMLNWKAPAWDNV
jgi:hypothetical protein